MLNRVFFSASWTPFSPTSWARGGARQRWRGPRGGGGVGRGEVRVKDGFIEFHSIVGAHGEVQYAELNSAKLAPMASILCVPWPLNFSLFGTIARSQNVTQRTS